MLKSPLRYPRPLLLGLLVCGLVIAGFVAATTSRGAKQQGTATPWSAQLAAVQEAVARIDKDALPGWSLYVTPTEPKWSDWGYDDPLEVQITYYQPSEDEIIVTFLDTALASSLQLERKHGSSVFSKGHYGLAQQLAQNPLSAIKVSPRDALQLTWNQMMEYAERYGLATEKVRPYMELLRTGQDSTWQLTYFLTNRDPRTETPEVSRTNVKWVRTDFEVNALTGTIARHEFHSSERVASPTASVTKMPTSTPTEKPTNTPLPTVPLPTISVVQQAQLYPPLPTSLDALLQYPGAQYLTKNPTSLSRPVNIEFETNDSPEAVEAFYRELVPQQGWEQATPIQNWGVEKTRYYYGDHGLRHVYGYYLSLRASDYSTPHLRTNVRLWIYPSLPIYLGATKVSESAWTGTDTHGETVEFTTKGEPDAVFTFYKDILAADAWTFDGHPIYGSEYKGNGVWEPIGNPNLIEFSNRGGSISIIEGGTISIYVQIEPSGETKVKVVH